MDFKTIESFQLWKSLCLVVLKQHRLQKKQLQLAFTCFKTVGNIKGID